MDLSNFTKRELLVIAKYYDLPVNKKLTRAALEAIIFLAQIQHEMSLHENPMDVEEGVDYEMVEKCEDC